MMSRAQRYILATLFLLVGTLAWGQDKVIFEVEVPSHIIAGKPFKVELMVNASAKDAKLATPQGLQLLYGPAISSTTSMRIVNGKRSSSRSTIFTYTFLAEKEGNYVIPEASVVVDGSTYRSASRRIKVFGAEAVAEDMPTESGSISSQDLYIVATPSKQRVYEQEAITINYKLYSRLENPQFTNITFPDYEGFVQYVQNDGGNAQFQAEQVNGKLYYTATFHSVVLYPQRAGKLTIKPAEFEMLVNMPISNPQRSIFDAFFDNFQQVSKQLRTKPITIDVQALPSPKPEGFNGAVGQFTLSSEIPTKVLKTNESFTMKLLLEGYGNIKLAQIPEPKLPEGFETYDPKETDDTEVSGGQTRGSKSMEYFAVPRHVGDFVIPAFPFSYFDPAKGSYQTITIPEVKLHIDKGDNSEAITTTGGANREDVKYIDRDIRYLKSGNTTTPLNRAQWHNAWWFYLLVIVLLIGAIAVDRKLEADNADTASNRSRKAGKTAQKYLKIASKMRSKGEASAYYEALLKGLSDYLSAKFHIPLSELSKDNIRTTMTRLGVSSELTEEAINTLSALEIARYTPSESEDRVELYDRATEVIEGIQKTKLKR
ncbi:BatD family protein [Porphyromonas levii]|uniref:BatD family protein n=1 Tax=Porphyromonas levii TaxID=28114 RepID=UPI001B8BB6F5|nr:BatD family protein [Porphyromonas levii]